MKRETLRKKNQLLGRISQKEYQSLLNYIENIYLGDYQIKILMARKFSNLFMALLPLVQEEDGGRAQREYRQKFSDPKKEPKIISNRAMAMVQEEIKNKNCRRILLADDIIIHGRTLSSIYDQLVMWFEENGVTDYVIDVVAYAKNSDGLIKNRNFLSNVKVEFDCRKDKWRAISNMIVDIFFLLGQPYTSYVPNSRIPLKSDLGKRLSNVLSSQNCDFVIQTSTDMKAHGMKSFSYIEREVYDFALNCSMRIYAYEKLQQYVLVPMVMLKPVSDEILSKYFDGLSWMIIPSSRDAINHTKSALLKYQTVVYLLSAMWGRKFIQDYFPSEEFTLEYDMQEERMNFNCYILDSSRINKNGWVDWAQKLKDINSLYRDDKLKEDDLYQEPGVAELRNVLNELYNKVSASQGIMSTEASRAMMGKFLYTNGEMDEERCLEAIKKGKKDRCIQKKDENQRLMGYPLVKMNDRLQDLGDEWLRAVLYAIDFGKGSIVPKCFESEGKRWYFSVLHAGEQNYKYFANTYFPFLFGLYWLEQTDAGQENPGVLENWKKSFVDQYLLYWKDKKHFFLEDDLHFLKELDVTADFGEVLDNISWDYFGDPDLDYAIKLSKNVMEI
ncbi:MAG: hypothetical protein HFG54_07545 [Lachnospiraceae bacterium]|jgi:hypothetical protein|nr:hypothetical protein [Lachnospiraceae bacterium]